MRMDKNQGAHIQIVIYLSVFNFFTLNLHRKIR